jgi:hypothetical protein
MNRRIKLSEDLELRRKQLRETPLPVPPRPWAIETVKRSIRIYSVQDKRQTVLWISLVGMHKPTEMAWAKFIVDTVNGAEP